MLQSILNSGYRWQLYRHASLLKENIGRFVGLFKSLKQLFSLYLTETDKKHEEKKAGWNDLDLNPG